MAVARPTAASCRSSRGRTHTASNVRCDALLVDTISRSDTYPYVDIREDDVTMGHEATVSKVAEDQLFYLMSRGMTEEEAMAMIVRGFIEPIARELPMEYALELNRLIEADGRGGRLMGLLADTTTDNPETQQSETTVPDAAPSTTATARRCRPHRPGRRLRPRPVPGRAHDLVRRRRLPDAQRAARRTGVSRRSTGSRPARPRRHGPPRVGTSAARGCHDLAVADERRQAVGIVPPQDRAAVAAGNSTARAMLLGIPNEAELTSRCASSLGGQGGEPGRGHPVVEAGRTAGDRRR